jgi:hypothetical protein
MGDYYRGGFNRGRMQGDYYRGDPGFWSAIGKIGKGIFSSVTGLGGGATKVVGLPQLVGVAPGKVGTLAKVGSLAKAGLGKLKKYPTLSAAGAAGAAGAMALGYHLSKRGGKMVRNKRMNVCNPRALRRAIRRTHGFAKLAMRTIHLVHPKKKVRFGGFKKRRAHK